jgi:death on curing protein
MISINEVLRIHEILIEKFGGAPGVRDKELLESSVFRPFGTFGSTDLYPTPIEKERQFLKA